MGEKPVSILCDYQGLLKASGPALTVNSVADYVDAYKAMVTALHLRQSFTVIVRDRSVAHWLTRAREKYGADKVEMVEFTARVALERCWKVAIPPYVTDREIIEAKLLDEQVVTRTGQSFSDIVLENFYSSYLTYEHLPLHELAELANSIDPERWKSNAKSILLRRECGRRLALWESASSGGGERFIVQLLRDEPQSLGNTLARFKITRSYPPQVGRRVLGETFDLLAGTKLRLDNLIFRETELSDTVDHIRVHLNERAKADLTAEVLDETLQQVSGELYVEYRAVKTMLEKARPLVTKALLQKIKDKFSPIRGRIASELAQLDLLIEPPRPQIPDSNWDVSNWLSWSLESYLPYHFWQEEVGAYDEEIAGYSEQYQEWFFKNYLHLRSNYPDMLYRAVVNVKDKLATGGKALFVVIDNLNYKFFDVLQELMRGRGYLPRLREPYLALIPTETEVCKKCLLAGEPEYSALEKVSYEQLVTKGWKDFFPGRSMAYLPNVTRLRELSSLDADIYFLNYLALDELLHSSAEHTGIPHAEAARNQLRELVAAIDEFAQRFQIEDNLTVYIIADHGSTKIAADVVNVIDGKFYQKKSLNQHHRFVTLSDEQLKNLPSNTEFQCYVLDRQKYGLSQNYLIARSYYRFLKTEDNFFVHGGLTPEETIVPFAMFRKAPVQVKQPAITLKDSTFRYNVKAVVVLEVVNPNEYPIQALRVELEATGLDYESLPPVDELSALTSTEVALPSRFRKGESETKQLRVRVTYEFAGRQQSASYEFPITVRAMVERQERRFR